MVQRALAILGEAQQVWPLAARWYDSLDKFARDSKGLIMGIEGSMADGVSAFSLSLSFSWLAY